MTTGQPIDSHVHLDHEPKINKYFKAAIKSDASDIHLKVGMKPKVRVHGSLHNTTAEPLTEAKIEELIFEILTEDQKNHLLKTGAIDFAWEVTPTDRFRVNVFRQRSFLSLAGRHITSKIPTFESLHLPPVVQTIADTQEGIILVTGPTGSGKSTTIASMIDRINRNRPSHIVTIEDPVEFVHQDKKSIVSQREIGIDVPDFDSALVSLMRQDPDVVLVGEMRDNETLTAAMRAAETGHLVFGTLHSVSAAQTIQRILDLFPQEERELARKTFGMTMKAVISQTLLPGLREDTPRVPAVEVLISNPIVKKLINEQREAELPSVIRASQKEGMVDLTESLRILVKDEWVDRKLALEYAPNVEELKMALKGIRSSSSSVL
jgi:twitching motility protein PilT